MRKRRRYRDFAIRVRDILNFGQHLLHFLGLEWDDRCLTFQETDSLVKTASVWQVRDELHAYSSGRRRNYTRFVQDIQALLL